MVILCMGRLFCKLTFLQVDIWRLAITPSIKITTVKGFVTLGQLHNAIYSQTAVQYLRRILRIIDRVINGAKPFNQLAILPTARKVKYVCKL
jgi:hypothetical protein